MLANAPPPKSRKELPQDDPRDTPSVFSNISPPPDLTRSITKVGNQHLAGGEFGDVYRCRYHGASGSREVAVKALRFRFAPDGDTGIEDKPLEMLYRELGVWGRLHHVNIVPFLGIAFGFGAYNAMSLVSLWMPNDTLHKFLAVHDDKLDVAHRLQILLDVANGLHYLHSFPIVHGNLNPNNVLLDADYTARLTDFWHVSNIPEASGYRERSTTRPGALRWISPEQIDLNKAFKDKITTKSDIYSFGCIALQVLSGKQPWSEIQEETAIILRLRQGCKPNRPEFRAMDDSHWSFIQCCWSPIRERPATDDILRSMQRLLGHCQPSGTLCDAIRRDTSTPVSALATAKLIERLQGIEYPEGVRGPREDLNKNAKGRKFRYDREFLLQFMLLCRERPPGLPPLGILGIEPMDRSILDEIHRSGRRPPQLSALTPNTHPSSVGLGITGGLRTMPGGAPSPFSAVSTPTSKDDGAARRDVSVPPVSSLATARTILRLQDIDYPKGIKSPMEDLNKNAKDGRFRYDREFLMQFMQLCKEKPPNLPSLAILGIERPTTSISSGYQPSSVTKPTSPQSSVGLGILGSFGTKPGSACSSSAMGQFTVPTSKLTEHHLPSTNASSSLVNSDRPSFQFVRPAITRPTTLGGLTFHCRRGGKRAKAALGAALDSIAPLKMSPNRWVASRALPKLGTTEADSPELMARKVRALLNKLTMEKFNSISDQIIDCVNESKDEKDARTLIQVARLVFESASDEAAWSEMYAQLCRKMIQMISPEVQDDGIKDVRGEPITGGQLFRKYLLDHCQEEFERNLVTGGTTVEITASMAFDDQTVRSVNERQGDKNVLHSDEHSVERAKRRGLGLIKLISELFKLQVIPGRIIHRSVSRLLGNTENPRAEQIEGLCQLLKAVGQLLDEPKTRRHMDMYFTRLKELRKMPGIGARVRFICQDVIELRDWKWVDRNAAMMPTISAMQPKAATETRAYRCNLQDEAPGSPRQNVLPCREVHHTGEIPAKMLVWMSPADVTKIDDNVKEFFATRNIDEADIYFTNLPEERRYRLVDKLVYSTLQRKEADAILVSKLFTRAASEGWCSSEVFEDGFLPTAEYLDDITIDTPSAFKNMAIMLKGAGFDMDVERLGRIAGQSADSDELIRLVSW